MKKILLAILIAVQCYGCGNTPSEESQTGSIYGVITDKATGEPVRAAGVQLNPVGTKAVTGDEGQYEFVELEPGSYTIQVTKTGYADLTGHQITVVGGKTNKGDVQLQLLPPSLRVTNNDKQDISELDFGDAEADITRSFNIFNDGVATLEWEITETSEWITKLSRDSGTLSAGATHAVIITIDREKLSGLENNTTIHITSNNGSKQLTIKASGTELPVLNTLAATSVSFETATINGEIKNAGTPGYTERGFVYSTASMPTIETTITRLTYPVNNLQNYYMNLTGLTHSTQYYVRAYAKNTAGIAYSSNEISFITKIPIMPEIGTFAVSGINEMGATFNGYTSLSNGTLNYTEKGFVYSATVVQPNLESYSNGGIISIKGGATKAGIVPYSLTVNSLKNNTKYYVRSFAITPYGNVYGGVTSFTTSTPFVIMGSIAVLNEDSYDANLYYYESGNMHIFTQSNAERVCSNISINSYDNWRLPTITELESIYYNRIAIGGFNTTSSDYTSSYWSQTQAGEDANLSYLAERYLRLSFSSGKRITPGIAVNVGPVRCVRTLP